MTSMPTLPPIASVALLNNASPLASSNAKESLDLALIFGSYEQAPRLFFSGDGVYQLIAAQDIASVRQKDFLKTFAAFEFYDIEDVFVCKSSLAARGFATDDSSLLNVEEAQLLEQDEFIAKLNQHSKILRF